MAKGILADGSVSDAEAVLLHEWMHTHPEAVECWPCDRIAARLRTVLADGLISEDERVDLADTMAQLVGGDAGILDGQNAATRLPLDEPTPVIHFSERRFVFTGKFASGTRNCQARVQQAGGHCDADVTMRTSYLVIGTFGSRDWVQTSHGRKIEKAVEYRTRGVELAIVGEQHWLRSCPAGVSA